MTSRSTTTSPKRSHGQLVRRARTLAAKRSANYPFDARFGRLAGYRSFAFDGPGYGARIVTNPLQPGGEDATNLGSYLSLEGTSFQRLPGAGADDAPGGAFYSPTDGWLEGPVQITAARAPQRLASWPVSARAPFTAVAPAAGHRAGRPRRSGVGGRRRRRRRALQPGQGWQREFLLTSSGAVSSPTLRAVAWPEPNRAYAVGDLGAMWLWRAETGLWEKDPAAPPAGFQGNLDGIAFDPNEPRARLRGRAERGAAQVRQDLDPGRSCQNRSEGSAKVKIEAGKGRELHVRVAFAGSEAMVVAEHDLLVNDGSGWQVEPEVQALLASLPKRQLYTVAGLPNGGAVLAGRDVVLERDSAGAPWHFSEQPIVDETAVAASAYWKAQRCAPCCRSCPTSSTRRRWSCRRSNRTRRRR